ncbi:Protein of unknown function [Lentzea fradiae]|uniref:DUF3040 domain-containing protein n=1 Tax=Lentzea fradiae TaxID=200378 RepID=A0A1G7KZX9_9PSEU|nr:DUF3040 domain-containing protein [Lentzea fradiae]SDF42797.1 Protein of unknown function [Lentzea fradiae]
MGLPENEMRQLQEIEDQLAEEDPAFVARLTRTPPPHQRLSRKAMSVVLLLSAYTVGLSTLAGGASVGSVVLIVLGALITAAFPVLVAFRAWRDLRGRP